MVARRASSIESGIAGKRGAAGACAPIQPTRGEAALRAHQADSWLRAAVDAYVNDPSAAPPRRSTRPRGRRLPNVPVLVYGASG